MTCSESSVRRKLQDEFLTELAWCASHFEWSVNRFGNIRGTHPEYWAPLCPIGAVWFARCREPVLPNSYPRLWEICDLLKLGIAAFELAEACDDAKETRVRQRLLAAVGMGKKGSK